MTDVSGRASNCASRLSACRPSTNTTKAVALESFDGLFELLLWIDGARLPHVESVAGALGFPRLDQQVKELRPVTVVLADFLVDAFANELANADGLGWHTHIKHVFRLTQAGSGLIPNIEKGKHGYLLMTV